MKDEEIEVKAEALYVYAHAGFPACGVAVVPWQDVPECIRDAWRRALRAARNEAIEEAARVAECSFVPSSAAQAPDKWPDEFAMLAIASAKHQRTVAAKAIRSLSSHPAGGNDGG